MKFLVDGVKGDDNVRARLTVDEDGDLLMQLSHDGKEWASVLFLGKDGKLRMYSYGLEDFDFLDLDDEGQVTVRS